MVNMVICYTGGGTSEGITKDGHPMGKTIIHIARE